MGKARMIELLHQARDLLVTESLLDGPPSNQVEFNTIQAMLNIEVVIGALGGDSNLRDAINALLGKKEG